MAVPQELLDILVCPACKLPVQLTPDGQGSEVCPCRRVYPIKDDIPDMIIEDAKIEAE